MAFSQEEVIAKYARFRELTDFSAPYTYPEAMKLIIELRQVDRAMLECASKAYMASIGEEDQTDWALLIVDGAV